MPDDKFEKLEKLANTLNKTLEIIADNEISIYLVGICIVFIFIYTFVKMILDFFSYKRIDDVIVRNSEALGKVHSALLILSTRTN